MLTLKDAAIRLGLSYGTLAIQARRGVLKARKLGNMYVVTAGEVKRYEREVKGRSGFASVDHPLHGKRGGGGRLKKET